MINKHDKLKYGICAIPRNTCRLSGFKTPRDKSQNSARQKRKLIDISQCTHYYLYIIWILRVVFAYSARLFLDFKICHSYTKDWQQHFCLHSPWNAQNKNVLNAIIKTANNFFLRSVVLPLLLAFALAFARQSLLFHLNPSLGALGN